MKRRLALGLGAGCAFMLGSLGDASNRTPADVPSAQGGSCTAEIAGWEQPNEIPEYLLWESLFADLERPSSGQSALGLASTPLAHVRTRAAEAVSLARSGRSHATLAVPTGPGQPEAVAAQAIVRARDGLIRDLDEGSGRLLRVAAWDHASTRVFSIPVRGKPVVRTGLQQCQVTIRGRDHPHLIPEWGYWQTYFTTYTMSAASYRSGPNSYEPRYLSAIRRNHLPIPEVHLVQMLETAHEVVAHLNSGTTVTPAEIVLSARANLLRSLPEESWLTVVKDAQRIRDSTTFSLVTR